MKSNVLISLRLTLKVCQKYIESLLMEGTVAQGEKKN